MLLDSYNSAIEEWSINTWELASNKTSSMPTSMKLVTNMSYDTLSITIMAITSAK